MNTLEKQKILVPFFTEVANKGYDFGVFDCANFASKAASLLLGVDVNARMGWETGSKLEIMRIIVESGGVDVLLGKVAKEFNFTKIENPMMAQFGDIAYSPRLNSLGVVESAVLYVTASGLARIALEPDMIIYRVC